jgi:hypothetical protein
VALKVVSRSVPVLGEYVQQQGNDVEVHLVLSVFLSRQRFGQQGLCLRRAHYSVDEVVGGLGLTMEVVQ